MLLILLLIVIAYITYTAKLTFSYVNFFFPYRFGKHRKPSDIDFEMESEDPMGDMEAARRAARDEQQRIQEQYRRLVQRHRQMEEQVANILDPLFEGQVG